MLVGQHHVLGLGELLRNLFVPQAGVLEESVLVERERAISNHQLSHSYPPLIVVHHL